ncbi:MAG: helix-turn-helix domain-containing protein [Lachnospiraceae bacterium]|nr:helix-turn-helix domain-containing protein [Lachnospiraceae bacterium]MDE6251722.1 helix-turn-helix domain-containing protein [Lachnospiraceae bacterium]
MDYISVKEAAEKWGISERRVQRLCSENRIDGVIHFSRVWAIPKNAKKPIDARTRKGRNLKNETENIDYR